MPPNTWVRLAIAVDLAASPPVIAKYINGSKVGEQSGTRDGRFALTPNSFALLFTDGYAGGIYTQPDYLNSLQVHNTRLSDADIGSLGGPTADGIPTQIQPKPFIKSLTPTPGQTDASPELTFAAVIADGAARLATNTVQLRFDGNVVTPVVTRIGSETTISYSSPGLLASESAHEFVLTYADEAQPPGSYTNTVPFTVARYVDLKLPAPFILEPFDSTPEGSLPAGWTETHYTDVTNPQFDLANLDSASYATWVVVDASRFEGAFVTYSNPNNPPDWETDYQRVLSFNPANVVNGHVVQRLAQGRLVFGNSGYRNGRSQVLYLFSPDFDLTGRTNVYLSFHSLWEQNEDSLGIGALGYAPTNTIRGNTWYRIAFAANLLTGRVTYYVNGSPVYTRTRGSLADGRFALYSDRNAGPDLRLFNEGDAGGIYTQELLVNSLLFLSRTLSAAEIAALGGPSASGIAPPAEPLRLTTPTISGTHVVLNWTGGRGPYQVQKATRLVNADWQDAGGATSQTTFSEPIGAGPTFYRVRGQ